jgi:hypothetical protein
MYNMYICVQQVRPQQALRVGSNPLFGARVIGSGVRWIQVSYGTKQWVQNSSI